MLQLKQVQQSFPFFFSSVELHCGCYTLNPKNLCPSVKLWFTNMYFVGFYSVSNLIVIIFNLVFPVSIVWFDCKGSVLERENVKTQSSEARRLLAGVSREALSARYSRNTDVSILYWLFAFQPCARHMLHFAGSLVARYSRELFWLQLLEFSHTFSL